MPENLMTLAMTREVFPYFKRLLEGSDFVDGDELIKITVDESPPGVIRLQITRFTGRG